MALPEVATTTRFDWPELLFHRFTDRFPFLADDAIKVEEFTEDGTMVVRAELPGIDPDKDVELTVANGYLTLHAERREEKKEEDKERYHSEFKYGSFTRMIPLPAGATEDDVKATYTDGILEVRMPLDGAKSEAHRVAITRT
jgi:HSP20 family protein